MYAPNWLAENSNLDRSEVQPSPFDKLRAGSSGLGFENGVLTHAL
jgi:hypothetical protein